MQKPFYSTEDIKKLEEAIDFATEKHKGQMRKSGEEYITHPLKVASFLVEWGMDIDTIIARGFARRCRRHRNTIR